VTRIRSLYPVLCCRDLERSRDFYCGLLDLEVVFECGWYTALGCGDDRSRQMALVLPDHPSVPAPFGVDPAGVLVSFEVDDVDAVHERATEADLEIALSLRDEEFGQRHFMTVDPNDLLVDVIQINPVAAGFLREVAQWRRAHR
jgi:catechol 2,3-dioxygenase-like lactoylglutathione lyase family enzyme